MNDFKSSSFVVVDGAEAALIFRSSHYRTKRWHMSLCTALIRQHTIITLIWQNLWESKIGFMMTFCHGQIRHSSMVMKLTPLASDRHIWSGVFDWRTFGQAYLTTGNFVRPSLANYARLKRAAGKSQLWLSLPKIGYKTQPPAKKTRSNLTGGIRWVINGFRTANPVRFLQQQDTLFFQTETIAGRQCSLTR